MVIAENHPLSRIPLTKTLPFMKMFRLCMKKPKKDFRYALRKALLQKLDIKMSKTDRMLEVDPFLRLGKFRVVNEYRFWYEFIFR